MKNLAAFILSCLPNRTLKENKQQASVVSHMSNKQINAVARAYLKVYCKLC